MFEFKTMQIVPNITVLLAAVFFSVAHSELLQRQALSLVQSEPWENGLVTLESHNGTITSLISTECFLGNVNISVGFASHGIFSSAYQALLCIFATTADNFSSAFSAETQVLEMYILRSYIR